MCVTMVAINTPVVELVHLLSALSLQRNAADAVMSCKHVHNLSVYIYIYIYIYIILYVYVCSCICGYHVYKKSGQLQ